jgi:endogenous inhibitor of DNA gyrase (YacG/DUF329 family)
MAYRPFCSARCRDVDLGRWLGGGYAIPGGDVAGDEDGDEAAAQRARHNRRDDEDDPDNGCRALYCGHFGPAAALVKPWTGAGGVSITAGLWRMVRPRLKPR